MTLDFKFYLSIFLRRLPYFLIVMVTITAIGVTIALILPPKYQAQALLLVESEQIPGDLAESTVRTGVPEQLEVIRQQLLTRDELLDLSERFGIHEGREDLGPTEIVQDLRNRIEISSQTGRSSGVTTAYVAFESASANEAFQVTNEIVTEILQANVEMRTGRATQTLEFFQQEVDRLGDELDRRESELLAFRSQHQNSLPDSLDYRRSRQAALQERFLQLQREEGTLNDRRSRLVELYERTGEVDQSAAALTPEQRQLRDLQTELEQRLAVYSPQNPRIKALEAQIAVIERRLAGVDTTQSATRAAERDLSLYEMQLEQIDGELEYLADQKALIEKEIATLQASIDRTPENAARLSEIERAQAITQGQYEQAVNRLAQARTGERIEVLAKGQRITVIEEPVLPTRPASPNRKLIAAGGLGAGMVLGLALVVLLELLNRSIRRPVEIVSGLGITPIATLPYFRTRRETLMRRGILAAAFALSVFGISGGLYALHTYYLPMDLLVERIVDKTGLGPLLGQFQPRVPG